VRSENLLFLISHFSFHIQQRHRVLLRIAYATPDGPGDDNRFVNTSGRAIRVNDVRLFLGMGFADGTAAEFTVCV
jgi:hypothetical protein